MSSLTTRDYGSNYSIKDYIKNTIAVNYFDFDDIDSLNIGIFGCLTDVEASSTEDISNIISTYAKEIFPNLAEIPESIYSYAGAYNVTDLFAKPGSAGFVLFLNESDITKNGTKNGSQYEYYLDAGTKIRVADYDFILDYDIKITYRTYRDELVFSATYVKEFENSISSITNPYIKIKRISYNGQKYLGLIIRANRVDMSEFTETLISNDKINLPKVTFTYNDTIAGFEVLYRAPNSEVDIQLEKRFYRAEPSKNPFCFFRFKDENQIELSFTSRDGYFQPKFNGEITVKIYTCNGESDNFPIYNGDDITVQPSVEKYPYNQNLIMLALIQTECSGATNMPTLNDIRDLYLAKMMTVDSYTTENDLQVYFDTIKKQLGNDVKFIKKRDDVARRLFSAFSIMKDSNGDIYHTNTLNLMTEPKELVDFNSVFIIRPGTVFSYNDQSKTTCRIMPELTIDDEPTSPSQFLYTSPFLIYLQKEQESVSFFYNSINDNLVLDYNYGNENSYVQFICSSMGVQRNAVLGEMEYKLKLSVNVSVDSYTDIVDEAGQDTGVLKIKLVLPNINGEDTCMVDFVMVDANKEKHIYDFEATIKTNDRISINNEMEINDVFLIDTKTIGNAVISMNTSFKILTFYDYSEDESARIYNAYSTIPGLENHTLTNIYTNDTDATMDLMISIPSSRSNLTYMPKGEDDFYLYLSHLPLISTDTCKDTERLQYLIDSIKSQYSIVQSLMSNVTNSFTVDMKFYNTYGRSNYFTVGEDEDILDRVNCKIRFKVAPIIGADETKLISNMKNLIKSYIEGINDSGYNGIYISNCIRELENSLSDIMHLKFISINEYDSMVQIIDNVGFDPKTISRAELQAYVPEFLTIELDDINIDIISNNSKTTK